MTGLAVLGEHVCTIGAEDAFSLPHDTTVDLKPLLMNAALIHCLTTVAVKMLGLIVQVKYHS